jgi:hypothetical protein
MIQPSSQIWFLTGSGVFFFFSINIGDVIMVTTEFFDMDAVEAPYIIVRGLS